MAKNRSDFPAWAGCLERFVGTKRAGNIPFLYSFISQTLIGLIELKTSIEGDSDLLAFAPSWPKLACTGGWWEQTRCGPPGPPPHGSVTFNRLLPRGATGTVGDSSAAGLDIWTPVAPGPRDSCPPNQKPRSPLPPAPALPGHRGPGFGGSPSTSDLICPGPPLRLLGPPFRPWTAGSFLDEMGALVLPGSPFLAC